MAIYDSKTAGAIKAGDQDNCFVINNIKSKTEAVFKASYIVASSMRISGKITALFDLIVLGDVEAEDIDVKGKFICTGDCSVDNSIIVQDKMLVGRVSAPNIEVHDQIIAQEIDADTISVDGNIIVGQTLAIEKLAVSGQNILCGETAYGSGRISANSIITVEELDMDDGEDSVVKPNEITFNQEIKTDATNSGDKYALRNNYEAYLTELTNGNENAFQRMLYRWRRALKEAEELFSQKELDCFDLGLLLSLTEITRSSYFENWTTIKDWWEQLLIRFNLIADGEGLGTEKEISARDFVVGARLRHKKYGSGQVSSVKKTKNDDPIARLLRKTDDSAVVDVLFDDGKEISFKLDMAINFFVLEKKSKYTPEELKEKLFIEPSEYGEWIAFLSTMETYGNLFGSNLSNIIKEMLYAKIGVKTKFISDRIKDNGWEK